MKFYKALPILSVVMAFVLSAALVSIIGAPVKTVEVSHAPANLANTNFEGTRVVAVEDKAVEAPAPSYDLDKVSGVVFANRVFGDWLYDDASLIESAAAFLAQDGQSVEGCAVQEFIQKIYGRTVVCDGIIEPLAAEPVTQQVVDVADEGGLLNVTTKVQMGCEEFAAVTILAPCQNEYGYMIVSARII